MRRYSALLLNCLVVLGLAFGGVLAGLSLGTVTSQTSPGSVSTGPEMAAAHGKRKNHSKRQHKNRKQHRQESGDGQKQHRHKQPGQDGGTPAELNAGVLPGAEAATPGLNIGKLDATGRYIVRFKADSGDPLDVTKDIQQHVDGVEATNVYRYVFPGFAGVIPADKLDEVRNDPRVDTVQADRIVKADAIPTGINRIDADQNSTANINGVDNRVNVDVAVIDSAGNGNHPDVNEFAWANCTGSHYNGDDVFHGTHVGGTIGALDNGPNFNGIDVVGVAPGARIWNIKVLAHGFGFDSWIICGLDIVTHYATDQHDGFGDIEVANMSLGGGTADPDDVCGDLSVDLEHEAVCRTVNAGVPVIVAAGNEGNDAHFHAPADYPEVITVSALADSNGVGGAPGPNTPFANEIDESLASFSNFGADVDIAAPGVDILSTVPGGGYERDWSGTSMATPHVTGAAALYLATHPNATPLEVRNAILNSREMVHMTNDNDGIDEGILKLSPPFAGSDPGDGTVSPPPDDGNQVAPPNNKKHKDKKHHDKHKKHGKGKDKKRR